MSLINEAKAIKETIIKDRRYLHENPEVGLDLPITSAYVKKRLEEMGYEPEVLGTSGVVAIAGGKKPGKTFLLRADMDALPIEEENDLPFKSNNNNMHACGHDFHTSMLLGAAQLLKNHENEIEGTIKLMFQPAEETSEGAVMMIENGVLKNPDVDAALMIHVGPSMPFPTGTAIISDRQPYAAIDVFNIKVNAKGCHGAMPNQGVDPLNIISHIHIALQSINAREISPTEILVLTVGEMKGGTVYNVIPDTAYMTGTIRTFDNETRDFAKKRMEEIAKGIASTFRATVEITYGVETPSMPVDENVQRDLEKYTIDMLGKESVFNMESFPISSKPMGSEDFAYIGLEVPSLCIFLVAGNPEEGYTHPIHHPKVLFNEDALPIGAAIYANSALEWLKGH